MHSAASLAGSEQHRYSLLTRYLGNWSAMYDSTLRLSKTAVLVCTYKRPAMLARLLGHLEAIGAAAPDLQLSAVVVDDDPAASARGVVDEFVAGSPKLVVEYVALGAQDISAARNAALEAGLRRAEWVAFIDDDCVPDADWLEQMFRIQQQTGADIVSGARHYFAAPDAPAWIAEEGFLLDPNQHPDGSVPDWGLVANVMLRQRWFSEHPTVRFDTVFGKTGGEDMVFLRAATDAGAQIRWAAHARVAEELPPDRANLRYLLFRQYWFGNNNVMIHLRRRWIRRSRMGLRVVRKWVCWWIDLVKDPILRRPFHPRQRAAQAAEYLGMTIGLFGIEVDHH
jgi:succinoglycan biosynthesis protein ExoM